jgi:Ca2+-binding EF-hand superfamily protein
MVGFLNARNCDSYRYLSSIGSTWKYDAAEIHPKLAERLYKRFDTFDLNSDGVMQMEEILYWPERVKEFVTATEDQLERMRSAIQIFFAACGVTGDGLKREDWVEGNQALAIAEQERVKRGESTLVALLGNSYFDVLDADGSGTVSLPELKTMMNVFQVPEEAAYTFFQQADTDNSGTLERAEMHALFTKFWLDEYDPKFDGIYAYKY